MLPDDLWAITLPKYGQLTHNGLKKTGAAFGAKLDNYFIAKSGTSIKTQENTLGSAQTLLPDNVFTNRSLPKNLSVNAHPVHIHGVINMNLFGG